MVIFTNTGEAKLLFGRVGGWPTFHFADDMRIDVPLQFWNNLPFVYFLFGVNIFYCSATYICFQQLRCDCAHS